MKYQSLKFHFIMIYSEVWTLVFISTINNVTASCKRTEWFWFFRYLLHHDLQSFFKMPYNYKSENNKISCGCIVETCEFIQ